MIESTAILKNPSLAVQHLDKNIWEKINRLHISKAIGEFAHELLIQPRWESHENEWNWFSLAAGSTAEYRFKAKIYALEHWYIDAGSITKYVGDNFLELDSLQFILEFKDALGISENMLPVYMEEITSTLFSAAFMYAHQKYNARKLALADYQTIEHAMTSGHPCFVANNGRIGFDATDYQLYSPEADKQIQLIWVAGHKSKASFSCIQSMSYEELLQNELNEETIKTFNNVLLQMDMNPEDYYFMPVHPWQWNNKIQIIFSSDIANGYLVYLGKSPDHYFVQQAIRTFYNQSNPQKFYTKTALSILNMGFMRGLSPYYMESTPAITEWIRETLDNDPLLQDLGFTMRCEVATVGYRNTYYEELGRSIGHNKMLAALWRESPNSILQPGQRLMTMAALLHRDNSGNALLKELISLSDLTAEEWIRQYLIVYFVPLLHCFYRYDLVFMPHGENVILILENSVPVKMIMKDITEEIMLFNTGLPLQQKVQRIAVPTPEDIKLLSIFTDVFDCFFRFLSAILSEHCFLKEDHFWNTVSETILNYQNGHPDLQDKFLKYDLFAPEFSRSCLNRLQLTNNQQMIDLSDPHKNLKLIGTLINPIAKFKIK